MAIVPAGGGDPTCVCSSVVSSSRIGARAPPPRFLADLRLAAPTRRLAAGRRFAAGRRLALVERFPVVRRFAVALRFAVVRRSAVVRRFTGRRFFCGTTRTSHTLFTFRHMLPPVRASSLTKKIFLQRGDSEPREFRRPASTRRDLTSASC